MNAKDFLEEEFSNAQKALSETLRFDYGMERSASFFNECQVRLQDIKGRIDHVDPADARTIMFLIFEIYEISDLVCSIERSQIGEFSWVFADDLRMIAEQLLVTQDLNGVHAPILHIMSGGFGYQIIYEHKVVPPSSKDLFVLVEFPRTLKNYVLLHSIFGHELAHVAMFCRDTRVGLNRVLSRFASQGALIDSSSFSNWINDGAAPASIQVAMTGYQTRSGTKYTISEDFLKSWRVEFMCDLFGLMLYGPAFMAAQITLLSPLEPDPYLFGLQEPTHPPFALRQKLLLAAYRLLGWDQPLLGAAHGSAFEKEARFITYLKTDIFDVWANIFSDAQIQNAINDIQATFSQFSGIGYSIPSPESLQILVDRLEKNAPPIFEIMSESGETKFENTPTSHILQAGWVHWIGEDPARTKALTFNNLNGLCNQALIQQAGIRLDKFGA